MAENMNATVEGKTGVGNTTENSNQQGQTEQSNTENTTNTNTEKTYTEKEMQSFVDKRVTEALKTAKTKWESEYTLKLEAEKDEAAKLAKMTAEEKAKVIFEKEKQAFEDERASYRQDKLVFETSKELSKRELPPEFAEMLSKTDAETTKANIDAFEKQWSEALSRAVEKRMRGTAPKSGAVQEDPFLQGFSKI